MHPSTEEITFTAWRYSSSVVSSNGLSIWSSVGIFTSIEYLSPLISWCLSSLIFPIWSSTSTSRVSWSGYVLLTAYSSRVTVILEEDGCLELRLQADGSTDLTSSFFVLQNTNDLQTQRSLFVFLRYMPLYYSLLSSKYLCSLCQLNIPAPSTTFQM